MRYRTVWKSVLKLSLLSLLVKYWKTSKKREIEEFLYQHPNVNAVQVIGIPYKKYGEQVLAAIQLKSGTTTTVEEFLEFCTGKIARFKIPKFWEFVKEYPMTASRKVQKYKLRELFAKKYTHRNEGDSSGTLRKE